MAMIVTDYDRKRLAAFTSSYQQGTGLLRKALDIEEVYNGDAKLKEALKLYQQALTEFERGLKSIPKAVSSKEKPETEKKVTAMRNHIASVHDRINFLTAKLFPPPEESTSTSSTTNVRRVPTSSIKPSTSAKKTGISALFTSQAEQEILGCIIESTNIRLNDIVGNDAAKQALDEAVILPAMNPHIFTGLRAPTKGILLFGPPGNGKTMLAKAVANEAGCTFFNISAATIMSKWVGEGEKMMRELFRISRERQPSIIFIDEIDSMLCARGEEENGASRRVKTEFLLQFDGVTSDSADRILVLGATNRPFDLDDGVLRRFPRRIFIDLPNAEARAHLILSNLKLTKTAHRLSSTQLRTIAEKTNGYSYSDLTALCREAAMGPVRCLSRSQLQRVSAGQIRPVQYEDVEKALIVIRPSTSTANQQKLLEFARDYAQV